MLDQEMQQMIAQAFCFAAETLHTGASQFRCAMEELCRPSTIHKPQLSIDGNQWCALYGRDLQDGVAGFGKSPELAMIDFDKQWVKKLPA